MKHNYSFLIGIVIFYTLSVLPGCDGNTSYDNGLLEGTISIGPLCPVETVPPSPGCLPTAETYKAYPVSLWTSDGSRKITVISPALDGSFRIDLNPGQYIIRLDRDYGAGGSNLPLGIVIRSQEPTVVEIKIDTGIR